MFANIVARDCKMWVPLPGAPGCPENGLNLSWRSLRAGYFWGGDGECITRIDADRLAASGHVSGSPHGQVSLLPCHTWLQEDQLHVIMLPSCHGDRQWLDEGIENRHAKRKQGMEG